MDQKVKNLYWHSHSITVEERRERYDYMSCVLWFTGLSAAGRSTLANSGISAPYEEPENPEIILDTDKMTLEECVEEVLTYLIGNNYIK
jgi:adenylylsulfate kinase-like enzyme